MKLLRLGLAALLLVACGASSSPDAFDAGASPEAGHKLGSAIYYPIPTSLPPSGAAGGDLGGIYPNPNVAKANGATVPAAGALSTSNVLQVNGASSLTYAPITNANLTPGTFSSVTGTGTLTAGATGVGFSIDFGTSTIPNVLPLAKLTGGTAGQVLIENAGATAPAWVTLSGKVTTTAAGVTSVSLVSGDLPNISTAGDVACSGTSGSLTSCNVGAISGSTPIAITPASLSWAATTVGPNLTQASESTAIKGADIGITPQPSTHATDQGGGNLVLTCEAPTGAGVEAGFIVNRGATFAAQIGPMPGAGATTSAVCIQPGVACDASHFTVQATTSVTTINAPSGGSIQTKFNGSLSGGLFMTSGTVLSGSDNSVTFGSAANRYSGFFSYAASFAGAISGGNNLPHQLAATSGALSVASPFSLTNAQIMTPLIQLTGVAGANLITVPNTVGGTWCFDFNGVTMGASSVKVGTGSGTTATIVAAALVGGLFSICCHVYASNFVSCGGG